MGFFDKLKQGLTKTRDNFSQRVDDIFKTFQKIDEELYEELEETLVTADVGINTSMQIIEELRTAAKEKKITDGEALKWTNSDSETVPTPALVKWNVRKVFPSLI